MILKFINREQELSALEAAYHSTKPEFFLIYGRRRIGKTELVKKFVEGKPHLYFMAKEQPVDQEIERLGERFSEKFNVHIKVSKDVDNTFTQMMAKVDPKEKFILVIDEFPFWVKKHRPILSEFQHLWDERLSNSNLLLILLGSSVSMMEDDLLSYNSPLYGRRTGQLKVEPMGPVHLKGFLPSYDLEDLIKVYGAVGGVPFYLKEFGDKKSFLENIKATFLNKSNILYEEAEILLREELREVTVYFNIMKAITDGETHPGDIATKAYVNITNISKYLNTLNTLGFITKESAITEPPKMKNYLYKVSDNYFSFWLRYVYPNKEDIEEDIDGALARLDKDLPEFMGHVFEDYCKRVIRSMDTPISKAPDLKVGKWWFGEEEIDIVAISEKMNAVLFAECKWSKEADAKRIAQELKRKALMVKWHQKDRKEHYTIFARGFHKGSAPKDIELFDLKRIKKCLKL